jgi:hypothetical protein
MAVPMVIMPMIVGVTVVMIMVMMGVIVVLVRIGIQLFRRNRRLPHLGQLDNVVDHLVFEDRGPELGEQLLVVAVVVVNLSLLAWELPHALKQCAAHLVVGDGYLIASADL